MRTWERAPTASDFKWVRVSPSLWLVDIPKCSNRLRVVQSITPATPETRRLRILIAEDSRTSAKWLRRCIRHLMFSRGLGSAEFVQCDNGLLAFKELLTRYHSVTCCKLEQIVRAEGRGA